MNPLRADLAELREDCDGALEDLLTTWEAARRHDSDLLNWSGWLRRPDLQTTFEEQGIALGLWFAHHGVKLRSLDLVVNALASLANRVNEPERLEPLCTAMGELMAAAPVIRQDLDNTNPGRPVAHPQPQPRHRRHPHPQSCRDGRSLPTLVTHLPKDAPAFFQEGMAQMTALNYPEHVSM